MLPAVQVIHELRAEALPGQPPGYFALHLRTQAGTYIKEFVHGGWAPSWRLGLCGALSVATRGGWSLSGGRGTHIKEGVRGAPACRTCSAMCVTQLADQR